MNYGVRLDRMPEENLLQRIASQPERIEILLFASRGVTWANLCWVCAASLSEPLPHYSHILWPIIDPILVTFG